MDGGPAVSAGLRRSRSNLQCELRIPNAIGTRMLPFLHRPGLRDAAASKERLRKRGGHTSCEKDRDT